jgi:hypothetical protein
MAWYAVNAFGNIVKLRKETHVIVSYYVPCDDDAFDFYLDADAQGNPICADGFVIVEGRKNAEMVNIGIDFMRKRLSFFMNGVE